MRRSDQATLGVLCLGVVVSLGLADPAAALSTRWAYEEIYDNVNGGDWYRDDHNETALLAWGESYVLMSLVSMARATGDPVYLDRLAHHVEGVLANRDDARGVSDYRGVSGACWQNRAYQPANEPYCYVVHTGMLTWPMVQFAQLVAASDLGDELASDGESFGAKAVRFVAAAEESVAFHDDQWDAAGYYVFRADAAFLTYAGSDVPLNQSNALGRTLFALHAVTGNAVYLDKATALASRFRGMCTVGSDGALLWNYWGGAFAGNGEDISHAALNVGFAVLAHEHGVAFTDADVRAMAATFTERIYIDDATFSDFVGGGSVNGSSYRPQVGRWTVLTGERASIWAAVRDVYGRDYASSGSGSILYGWALLAEHEPPSCSSFFYSVDWEDQGAHRQATAYGANILTAPPALTEPCVIPLEVDVPRDVVVAQWDGSAYHRVQQWRPTAGFASRRLAYEPGWPFVYWSDGILFQFEDAFVAGDGLLVMENEPGAAPAIDSTPPATVELGGSLAYAATGTGAAPVWWSLVDFPNGARVEAASGSVTWIPGAPGAEPFVLRLENDWGVDEQAFTVTVPAPAPDGGPAGDSGRGEPDSADGSTPTGDGGDERSSADGPTPSGDAEREPPSGDADNASTPSGGCACESAAGVWPLALLLVLWRPRRARS